MEVSLAFQGLERIPDSELKSECVRLDLTSNAFRAFDQLSSLPNLRDLVLDDNGLEDGFTLPHLPKLESLSLNKNQLSEIEPLLSMLAERVPSLTFLSLHGNMACPNELVAKGEADYQRYRYYVLHQLPRLRFLDSRTVTPEELKEAKRVGPFMKVVRPKLDVAPPESAAPVAKTSVFSPLPADEPSYSGSRATMGKLRYVYYGRHSEGNRFIRNNDL